MGRGETTSMVGEFLQKTDSIFIKLKNIKKDAIDFDLHLSKETRDRYQSVVKNIKSAMDELAGLEKEILINYEGENNV